MHNESFKLRCFDNKEQLYFHNNIKNIPSSVLQNRLSIGLNNLLGHLDIDCADNASETPLKDKLKRKIN